MLARRQLRNLIVVVVLSIVLTSVTVFLLLGDGEHVTEVRDAGPGVKCSFTLLPKPNGDRILDGPYENRVDGLVRIRGQYRNGLKSGVWTRLDREGDISSEEHFIDGELSGWSRSWYRVGKTRTEQYMVKGQRHGPGLTIYEPTQQIIESWTYVDGRREGLFLQWHLSGQLKSTVLLVHGQSEGKRTEWFESGQIRSESYFKGGEKVGIWKYYDAAGNEIQRTVFDK